MAVPTSKADLLAAITITFDKLMTDLSNVPLARARERTLDGHVAGTNMSPADLVSYLVGWNELVLKWLDQDDRAAKIDFPAAGFQWNQLGQLAHKFYRDYEPLDYPQLLDRLTIARDRLVETISGRSDDELYGASWYGKWTKGRMIQLNTSSPYINARGRIRKWLRTHTRLAEE